MTDREKIIDVLRDIIEHEVNTYFDDNYTDVVIKYEALADALIKTGYGYVAEWKRRAEVAERKFELLYAEVSNSIILPTKEKYKEQAERGIEEEQE